MLVVLLKKQITRVAEIDTKASSLDGRIAKNKNEFVKNILEDTALAALLFLVNTMFDWGDGFLVYLIFQPVHKYSKIIANAKHIFEWKSKGLSDESIKPIPTSDNNLIPLIDYYGYYIRLKLNGGVLRKLKFHILVEKKQIFT